MSDSAHTSPSDPDPQPDPHKPTNSTDQPPALERELTGNLPCVVCGYDLKGLSILATCSECGTAVRATILAVVDPHARELIPLHRPRRIAIGLLLWSGGALLASLIAWIPELTHLIDTANAPTPNVATPVTVALILSAIGAASLIRPHARVATRTTALAAGAVLAYIPLILIANQLLGPLQTANYDGLLGTWPPDRTRTIARLFLAAVLMAMTLAIRPSARILVARCLVLRTGRVDRQTLLALAASAGLVAIGDMIALIPEAAPGTVTRLLVTVIIATGSVLFTFGLVGTVIDSYRIAGAIRRPGPTLGQLLDHDP